MANTTRTSTAKKSTSGRQHKSTKKKEKNSYNGKKILAIAGIAGIAAITVACMGRNKDSSGISGTNTLVPTKEVQFTQTPEATPTVVPTDSVTLIPTLEPTMEVTPEITETPEATPTPAISIEQAIEIVKDKVKQYDMQLINDHLQVGNHEYYQFGAIDKQEFLYPFLVVDKADGVIYFYDSNDQTVFDFTTFPIVQQVSATPTPTKVEKKELTVQEAYQVLCTYSKEKLKIAKEVKEYNAEYGDELTLIDGNQCYRVNLSEVSGGKVRNRGEFYISVDGTKCYYIDNNTNEFILANK